MKSVLVSLMLIAAPAAGQSHADVVARHKAILLAQGEDLSGKCGAFKIVRAVVWELRAEGWGLIHSTGSGCVFAGDIFRADATMLRTGTTIDMLDRAESDNGDTSNPQAYNRPAWNRAEQDQSPDNWRPPFASGPTPVPPPSPIPTPVPTPTLDLSGVYSRLDLQYQQLIAGYQQAERIYTDHINRLAALSTQIAAVDDRVRRHDEEPAWLTKVLSNRYVQLAMTAVGVYITQRQLQPPQEATQ